ncbi:ras guanine nucleotide exchange factor i-related [Anaeramoeba ignava]|uniref:Ras guanine nucleotide exchange factor i-related n=1 Tax=Anaeramoeba ignava TaxID=1746090 RepID=A0A9Q0RH57_ANAIG|nr:ras guanine nucleotide exchange factor i-related [Anaeramoeba ignava]
MEIQIGGKYKFSQEFCTVKFEGETHFAPGLWVGIELFEPNGKSDGTIDGIKYFDCKPKHGIFIRKSQLKPLSSEENYQNIYSHLIDTIYSRKRNIIHHHSFISEKLSSDLNMKKNKLETLESYLKDSTSVNPLENPEEIIEPLEKEIESLTKILEKKTNSTKKYQEEIDKLSKDVESKKQNVQVQSDIGLKNQIDDLNQELTTEKNRQANLQQESEKLQNEIISMQEKILKENESLKRRIERRERKIKRLERSQHRILRSFANFDGVYEKNQEKDKEEQDNKERQQLQEIKEKLKKKNKSLTELLEQEKTKNEYKVELGEVLPVEDQTNRALWIAKLFKKHTKILELRERLNKIIKKFTFARFCQNSKTEVPDVLSKDIVDSLIIQYFHFTKKEEIANFLSEETGVDLQKELAQEETKLVELLRLGILDMEHLWDSVIDEKARFGENVDLEFNRNRDKFGFELLIEGDTYIWDEPEDNPSNIRYNQELVEKLNGDPSKNFLNTIQAANINKLLEKLTYEKSTDMQFIEAFLSTYQTIITPEFFLYKLIQRFRVPKMTETEDFQEWNTKRINIQTKVAEVIRLWIEKYLDEFEPKLISHLETFFDRVVGLENPKLSKKLKSILKVQKLIQSGVVARKRKVFQEPPEDPKVPKNIFARDFQLSDLSEEEFAKQTTIFISQIYKKISPTELVTQAWSKERLHSKAPNVLLLIKKFNEIVGYISTQILIPKKAKQRAKQMIRFIKIAELFFNMKNFDCTMAIMAAFINSSISRLTSTKDEVSEKYWKIFQNLDQALSSDNGYREYRSLLKRTEPPGIPYLGVFLTEITAISDGSENKIDGLFNFSMRKLLANTINEIQKFQQADYNFIAVDQVQNLFAKPLPLKDSNALYKKSLKREPRK